MMNEYLVLANTFVMSAPSFESTKLKELFIGNKIKFKETEKKSAEGAVWYRFDSNSWIDSRVIVRLENE